MNHGLKIRSTSTNIEPERKSHEKRKVGLLHFSRATGKLLMKKVATNFKINIWKSGIKYSLTYYHIHLVNYFSFVFRDFLIES